MGISMDKKKHDFKIFWIDQTSHRAEYTETFPKRCAWAHTAKDQLLVLHGVGTRMDTWAARYVAGIYLLLNSVMINNLREFIRLIQLVLIRYRITAWYDSGHSDPPGCWVDIWYKIEKGDRLIPGMSLRMPRAHRKRRSAYPLRPIIEDGRQVR